MGCLRLSCQSSWQGLSSDLHLRWSSSSSLRLLRPHKDKAEGRWRASHRDRATRLRPPPLLPPPSLPGPDPRAQTTHAPWASEKSSTGPLPSPCPLAARRLKVERGARQRRTKKRNGQRIEDQRWMQEGHATPGLKVKPTRI